MLLLDTHVLLWLEIEPHRVGRRAAEALAAALADGELGVSTLTFWEIGTLIARRRVALDTALGAWRSAWLADGLVEVAPEGEVAIMAAALRGLHRDPIDRLIVATALASEATLVTADEQILAWPGPLGRLDAKA